MSAAESSYWRDSQALMTGQPVVWILNLALQKGEARNL
jgi:hypothetical protein